LLGHSVSDSPETLSIASQRNPISVASLEVNVLNAPLAGKLRILVADGDGVRIGGEHLVALGESVITKDSADACSCVSNSKVPEDVEELAPSLWREPFGETPIGDGWLAV
jgi:hypothetical protein